ncbi:MAG TPA: hypothetical protein VGD65_25870 [Chryseosolibacter sp.]
MRWEDANVKKTTYSVTLLKQTLIDILEHGPGVCVHFRLIGELWQPHFVRIVGITDHRVLVNDEVRNKLISIDLSRVMQFEIDHRFKGIEPLNHYDVIPDSLVDTTYDRS